MKLDDSGMTLIELLLAMFISVFLIGVIGAAFIVSIRINENSRSDLAESADTQLTTAFLPADLLSIGAGGLDSSVSTTTACAAGAELGRRIVRLSWSERVSGAVDNYAAEYRVRERGGVWELIRYACRATEPATLAAAAAQTDVVAANLRPAPTDSALPAVVEDGRRVSILVTTAPSVSGDSYSYSLTGTRRTPLVLTLPAAGPPLPPLDPLLPQIRSLQLVGDAAGNVSVEATFSAAIPPTCLLEFDVDSDTTRRTYGGTAALVSASVARLPLDRVGTTDPLTSASDLDVTLLGDRASCLAASFTDEPVTDRAAPVLASVQAQNTAVSGTPRRFDSGDTLTLTFSEPVTNLPASLSVQLAGGSNTSQPDALTLSGVWQGNASLGRTDYITSNKTVSSSGAPTTTGSTTTAVLSIPACPTTGAGNCADATNTTQAGGSGTFTFRQVGNLLDAAGNSLTVRGIAPVDRTISNFEAF